jgi:hypothetical protein
VLTALNRDIVDTEPSNGNIYKMLLGSVVDVWDAKNDEETVEDDDFDDDLSPTGFRSLGYPIRSKPSNSTQNEQSRRHFSDSSQGTQSPPSSHGWHRWSDADESGYFSKGSSPYR